MPGLCWSTQGPFWSMLGQCWCVLGKGEGRVKGVWAVSHQS